MNMKNGMWPFVWSAFALSLASAGTNAQAQVDSRQVSERLEIMQKHVQELKLRALPTARLRESAASTLHLQQRFYRQGEKWSVRFEPTSDAAIASMARKSAVDDGSAVGTEPLLYDYEVLAVGAEGNARISITQRVARPEGRADGHVDHLVLVVSPRFTPVSQEIYYRDGRPPRTIAIAARGNLAMGFSATPTDLPNLLTDDGVAARDADGSPGLGFTTVDIYGRAVTTFWREGEVWPSSVKMVSGTATLLR